MGYKNFKLAVYCPVGSLTSITDLHRFEEQFRFVEKHLHIDKVYLETFRDFHTIDPGKMKEIKNFFQSKGIQTSGGITTSAWSRDGFGSMCYTNGDHKNKLKEIVIETAKLFDEIILDDFYFSNCKCTSCIQQKGELSWAKFRCEMMKEISRVYVIKPAKQTNPSVNLIIKYPNWYEHYQETGYNLKDEPELFDMIYTGTETRNPQYTHQHLPRYLSYFMIRYMENVKPGKNGGGWFDPFQCSYNPASYADQGYLTLLGKAAEVTLFSLGNLISRDYALFVPVAGYVMDSADEFLGELGKPTGTAAYIPYHSS
ncbi:MAG: permease, partial [Ruminiclostridium sp.]|nr:permease [Ruminiclostridium sp.]